MQKYGSPNVFDQFAPHVTLAYNDADTSALAHAVAQFAPTVKPVTFTVRNVATANVGPDGTVIRRGLMSSYCIPCSSSN